MLITSVIPCDNAFGFNIPYRKSSLKLLPYLFWLASADFVVSCQWEQHSYLVHIASEVAEIRNGHKTSVKLVTNFYINICSSIYVSFDWSMSMHYFTGKGMLTTHDLSLKALPQRRHTVIIVPKNKIIPHIKILKTISFH